jgi:hypothetical protein
MDRRSAVRALARAEANVRRGDALLLRLKERIAALERVGRDATLFKNVLTALEDSQRMHIAARDQLRKICNNDRT